MNNFRYILLELVILSIDIRFYFRYLMYCIPFKKKKDQHQKHQLLIIYNSILYYIIFFLSYYLKYHSTLNSKIVDNILNKNLFNLIETYLNNKKTFETRI